MNKELKMMKRINTICLILVVLLTSACNKKQNNEDFKLSNQGEETQLVEQLDTEEFIAKVCDINGNSFKYKGNKPCVIDFYATWCGPCKRQSPIIDKLAEKYSEKVHFYKVDVDQAREVAQAFKVHSIPMIVICPVPGEAVVLSGLQDYETLEEMIISYLLKDTSEE